MTYSDKALAPIEDGFVVGLRSGRAMADAGMTNSDRALAPIEDGFVVRPPGRATADAA